MRASATRRGCSRTTVIKWRTRYRTHGLPGLADLPRSGAPATFTDTDRRDLITAATADPPAPRARWTHALLAAHLQTQQAQQAQQAQQWRRCPSRSWIGAALRTAQLPVHKVRGWLHRKPDPHFHARLAAIEDAVAAARAGNRTVVCLDEKTAVPVRTPCHGDTRGPDGIKRREFEYIRRGTVSWYGTQDVATGEVALVRATTRMNSDAFTMMLDDHSSTSPG